MAAPRLIFCVRAQRKLVALYAPEHGVRGEIDGGRHVKTYRDKTTGLPVYSLVWLHAKTEHVYVARRAGFGFDIQDIGSRSYTFISTMGECMKACAEHKIPLVVLDRPNPIGSAIEGNIANNFSFVCPFPIPYRHGLTIGRIGTLVQCQAW